MYKFPDKRVSANELESIVQTLNDGWLAPGTKAALLEKMLPEVCGFKYGVLLNSRASAIFTAFLAFGIGKGSTVLVSSISHKTHVEIPKALNANVEFYDVERENISCDYGDIRKRVGKHDIQLVILQNENLRNKGDELLLRSDREKTKIMIDLGYDAINVGMKCDVGVIEFDGICALIMFNNFEEYNSALCIRDWGRVGTQDEDVNKRYDGWVLGNNVRYDYKFVYGNLGFNFKSCEMSATLAANKFNQMKERCDDFDALRDKEGYIVSNNGYTLIIKNGKFYQEQLKKQNIKYETIDSYGYVLNKETEENKYIYDNFIIINNNGGSNLDVVNLLTK